MHGVHRALLQAQADSTGIPLMTVKLSGQPGMAEYEAAMMHSVSRLKQAGCTHAVFGGIFLEDLKIYSEKQLQKAVIDCVFPLWKRDTKNW
ncbi:MAG TPA: hypothetical protein VMT76_08655 [Puia sp.]|nr:hypothetical protein [Puia sp.]